jgi:hypothetical protein
MSCSFRGYTARSTLSSNGQDPRWRISGRWFDSIQSHVLGRDPGSDWTPNPIARGSIPRRPATASGSLATFVPLAQRSCSRPISDLWRFDSFTEHSGLEILWRGCAAVHRDRRVRSSSRPRTNLGRHVPRRRAALAMRLRPVRFRSYPRLRWSPSGKGTRLQSANSRVRFSPDARKASVRGRDPSFRSSVSQFESGRRYISRGRARAQAAPTRCAPRCAHRRRRAEPACAPSRRR